MAGESKLVNEVLRQLQKKVGGPQGVPGVGISAAESAKKKVAAATGGAAAKQAAALRINLANLLRKRMGTPAQQAVARNRLGLPTPGAPATGPGAGRQPGAPVQPGAIPTGPNARKPGIPVAPGATPTGPVPTGRAPGTPLPERAYQATTPAYPAKPHLTYDAGTPQKQTAIGGRSGPFPLRVNHSGRGKKGPFAVRAEAVMDDNGDWVLEIEFKGGRYRYPASTSGSPMEVQQWLDSRQGPSLSLSCNPKSGTYNPGAFGPGTYQKV